MIELKEVNDIKAWWFRLSLREQRLLMIGGILLSILLIYLIIFRPIIVKVDVLKEDISNQKALLTWMQTTVPELQGLRGTSSNHQAIPSGSLLTFVEQSLKQSGLSNAVTTLEKSADENKEGVQLNFDKVGFDNLMTWLINFWREYNVVISQFSITRGNEKGMVQANVLISLENAK